MSAWGRIVGTFDIRWLHGNASGDDLTLTLMLDPVRGLLKAVIDIKHFWEVPSRHLFPSAVQGTLADGGTIFVFLTFGDDNDDDDDDDDDDDVNVT